MTHLTLTALDKTENILRHTDKHKKRNKTPKVNIEKLWIRKTLKG